MVNCIITLHIITFSLLTFSIRMLYMMTLIIATDTQHNGTCYYGTQYYSIQCPDFKNNDTHHNCIQLKRKKSSSEVTVSLSFLSIPSRATRRLVENSPKFLIK